MALGPRGRCIAALCLCVAVFLGCDAYSWDAGAGAGRSMTMMSSRPSSTRARPLPRCKASTREEYFKSSGGEGDVRFGGVQEVSASLPQASLADLSEYLYGKPERIIYACWDNKYLEKLSDGSFRIYLRSFEFLSLKLDFSIDVKLWEENGWVKMKSTAWSATDLERLLGKDFVDNFQLRVSGQLRATELATAVRGIEIRNPALVGEVDVDIGGRLPPLLQSFPESIVKNAALGINQRVIDYAVNIFFHEIDGDFRKWHG